LDGDSPPLAANSGIDHRQKDRTGRKVGKGCHQAEAASGNILDWNLVGDVDYLDSRVEAGDRSFHHADIAILPAKVAQQGNNLSFGHEGLGIVNF
jgi:hypothetical protein